MPAPARYGLISLERTIAGLDRELTYLLPPGIADWEIGQPVVVPLRSGRAVGFLTGFADELDFDAGQLKSVEARLSDQPLFDDLALKIARWMSAYYHCPLPDCLAGWIPAGATPALDVRYEIVAPRTAARAARFEPLTEIILHRQRGLGSQKTAQRPRNRRAYRRRGRNRPTAPPVRSGRVGPVQRSAARAGARAYWLRRSKSRAPVWTFWPTPTRSPI